MRKKWDEIPYKPYLYTSLALSLLTALVLVAIRPFLPPVVPLFYGKASGESQLVNNIFLLIAPAVSLVVGIINTLLAMFIADKFIKKVLIISLLFIASLLTITVIKIVLLVGFF